MRPLGTLSSRWEDNIKVGLTETGCKGVDFIKGKEFQLTITFSRTCGLKYAAQVHDCLQVWAAFQ
jgi:hypothetical protein